jgi:hypothetical protein
MTRDPGLSSSLRPSAVSLNFTESLYLKRQDGEVQTETIVNNGEKISPTEGKVYQVKVHWNFGETVKSTDLRKELQRMILYLKEPYLHSSTICTFYISILKNK